MTILKPVRATCLAIGLCAATASALIAPATHAAVVMALDLPALVEQSELVIVAAAQKQSSRYVNKLIVTDVTLQVIDKLKGNTQPGETVVVTHLGGSVGDIGLSVPGAASFKLGQSAVVFLKRARSGSGDWNVTGMSQGVLPITGQGAAQNVMPGGDGAALMARDGEGRLVERHTPAAPRMLTDVVSEIRQLIGR
jgi:hypothetical protein